MVLERRRAAGGVGMRDRRADLEAQPGDGEPKNREAWFPAGTVMGGVSVESASGTTRRPPEHLVALVTDSGRLVSPPDQAVWARRKATSEGGPYGAPEWTPASRVRLGDWLCRPRTFAPDLWLPVTAVSQHTTDQPLYRFDAAEEAVLAYGFVARAERRRP